MHSRPIVLVALLVAAAAQWGVPSSAAPAKPPAPSRQAIAVGAKLCDRADALLKAGKAKEALALYEQALKLLPASPRARAGVNAARKRLAGAAAAPPKPAEPAEPAPGAQAGAAQPAEAQRPVKELSLDSAETARSLLLAVLPFRHLSAHAENAWVGEAAAETLAAKLAGLPGVQLVERQRLQEVIQAGVPAQDADAAKVVETGKLLGAEALVLGSVQSTGVWDRPGSTVRLDARVVRVETGQVAGDTAVSVDGPFQDLLRLQRELAEKLLRALGVAPSEEEARLLAAEDARSLEALRAFGEGRRLMGEKDYRGALALLQEAQRKNVGEFFTAAHRAEGDAYAGLVESATEEEKAGLRKEYLEKFRRDAEEAAPAFYDLGLAYEANKLYAEAIQAYDSFLKHAGQSARSIRWQRTIGAMMPRRGPGRSLLAVGDVLVVGGGLALDGQTGEAVWRLPAEWSADVAAALPVPGAPQLLLHGKGRNTAVDVRSGRIVWQADGGRPVAVGPCYVFFAKGAADGCNETGRLLWRRNLLEGTRAAIAPGRGVTAHHRFDNVHCGVLAGEAGLIVTGKRQWEPVNGYSGVPVVIEHVLASVDPGSGNRQWQTFLGLEDWGASIVPFGKRVAVVVPRDKAGTVDIQARNALTGAPLWKLRASCRALAGSDQVLALCADDRLVALDAETGRALVSLPVPGLGNRLGWNSTSEPRVLSPVAGPTDIDLSAGVIWCQGRYVFLLVPAPDPAPSRRAKWSQGDLLVIDAPAGRMAARVPNVREVLPAGSQGYYLAMSDGTLVARNPPGRTARVQDVAALCGVGRCQLAFGRAAEGAAAFTRAVEARPDATAAWLWLADASVKAEDGAIAVSAWWRALGLLPVESDPAASVRNQLSEMAGIAWVTWRPIPVGQLQQVGGVLCCLRGATGGRWAGATAEELELSGTDALNGASLWTHRLPQWQRQAAGTQLYFYGPPRLDADSNRLVLVRTSHDDFGGSLVTPLNPASGAMGPATTTGRGDLWSAAGTFCRVGVGTIEGVDAASGAVVWRQQSLPAQSAGKVSVAGDLVLFPAPDDTLTAADLRTGNVRWKWKVPPARVKVSWILVGRDPSALVLKVAGEGQWLVALDLSSGKLLGACPIGRPGLFVSGYFASTVRVCEGRLYALEFAPGQEAAWRTGDAGAGHLRAWRLSDGADLWRSPELVRGFTAGRSGDVVALSDAGDVVAYEGGDGRALWRLGGLGDGRAIRLASTGGPHVYVADDRGTLYAIDTQRARASRAAGRRWWR